jgi:DNA-binding response OmpR family regulator
VVVPKPKVLIVEDEQLVAFDMRDSLTRNGYTVTDIAITATEAIASFQRNPADIVLMDVLIKGELDGIETAKKMRESAAQPVIIFTTGVRFKELPKEQIILEKPFNSDRLLELLLKLETKQTLVAKKPRYRSPKH